MYPMRPHETKRFGCYHSRIISKSNRFQIPQKDELRRNASRYFSDISKILATVDRQLLLLMKTNDLIRSIAFTLGNDERRSFLTMTRACFQMLQDKQARAASNVFSRAAIQFQSQWFYFKLYLYSFYLWLTWHDAPRTTKSKPANNLSLNAV